MIRRGFEAGWGFAVTKTFALDKVQLCSFICKLYVNMLKVSLNFDAVNQ